MNAPRDVGWARVALGVLARVILVFAVIALTVLGLITMALQWITRPWRARDAPETVRCRPEGPVSSGISHRACGAGTGRRHAGYLRNDPAVDSLSVPAPEARDRAGRR